MAVLFSLLMGSGSLAQSTQQTSELLGGRWVDVSTPSTTQPAPDPALLRVEQLLLDGKISQAKEAAVAWLKTHKGSPVYDRGLYLMAEALFHEGDVVKSFFYLDQLLDEHPESPLFYQSLEKQYAIAEQFLNGRKRKLLGMPMMSAEEEGVEMLFRIQQRAPKSPIAEKSTLRTADYYYAAAEYDLAADAYRSYIESYPRSPNAPRAMLRQAYANMAQFRGLKFDANPVIEARSQLQDVVAKYPDLAAQENIPELLNRIDNTMASKLAVQADFYRRTHEPRAAIYTYELLIKRYPDSPEVGKAQQQLAQLRGQTHAAPVPVVDAPIMGPTTAPVPETAR